MILDYDGRVVAQAEPGAGEKIVVGPTDMAALRGERERRRGYHMLAHLRTEAYPAYRQPIYPAGRASDGPITTEKNEASRRRAHESLRRISHGRP
jgi:hypothetical protein